MNLQGFLLSPGYDTFWIFAQLFHKSLAMPVMSAPFMFVSLESGHVPSTTAPAPMPSYCLTSNGHRYEEGDGWHDGCRDCYCHSGREMCVLISCPVPSCAHPVVRPDQCCPTCEGMSRQFERDFILCPVLKVNTSFKLYLLLKDNSWLS